MLKSHHQPSYIKYPIKSELVTDFLVSKGFWIRGFDLLHKNIEHGKNPYILVYNGHETLCKTIPNPIKIEKDTLYLRKQVTEKLKEANLSMKRGILLPGMTDIRFIQSDSVEGWVSI